MTSRSYGQFCGLARALELVGERWAMLLVRDLLVEPKRFSDLRRGLPKIPTNVLSARLREMEEGGVVRRRLLERPQTGYTYELTEYGQELEQAVLSLGRWGAQLLGEPREDEIVTTDSMVMALRSTFRPEHARNVRFGYELRMGPVVVHAVVHDGELTVATGPLPEPDLVIESGPAVRALMAGELTPAEALRSGQVKLTGEPALLDRFIEQFHIGPVVAQQKS